MANTIQIDVVSAEESILSEEAEFVVAPAKMGEVGIYPNHASMITLLKAGSVRIKKVNKSGSNRWKTKKISCIYFRRVFSFHIPSLLNTSASNT